MLPVVALSLLVMTHRTLLISAALLGLTAFTSTFAADVSGKWQAEFDSPVGKQKYVYTLQVSEGKLTGQAVGEFANEKHDTVISEGKIEGAKVSFVEMTEFGGNSIRIEYNGELAGDQLRLKRKVGDFGVEDIVATRVQAAQETPPATGPRPRGGRGGMPSMPKPGPCPLPILPALPALDDTGFFAVRDVPHGKVEPVNYKNTSGQEKRMHIYLPPDYERSFNSRYPVLYLNHGGGDDDSKWTSTDPRNGGNAQFILDNLIAAGKAKPMIIVMPNTRSLASPNPPAPGQDDACTRDYLQAIIPYVDSHYRTKPSREYRALAGLSMGGFVVMNTGLPHLDTFSELYVYSSGYFSEQLPAFEENFQTFFKDPNTNGRFRVPFYLAEGETDIALLNGQKTLAVFNKYGIRNFWVLSSGGHEWANWRRYLHQTAQIMFPDCDAK
jgi:enterochelin esterase-like enzyme